MFLLLQSCADSSVGCGPSACPISVTPKASTTGCDIGLVREYIVSQTCVGGTQLWVAVSDSSSSTASSQCFAMGTYATITVPAKCGATITVYAHKGTLSGGKNDIPASCALLGAPGDQTCHVCSTVYTVSNLILLTRSYLMHLCRTDSLARSVLNCRSVNYTWKLLKVL